MARPAISDAAFRRRGRCGWWRARFPSLISGEAVRHAGLLERRDHLGLGELAAGDQLKEAKGGAVERVVAAAGRCGSECSDLGSQSGVAVGAGMAGRPDHRHGALGDGALRAWRGRHLINHCGAAASSLPGIAEEGVAVPRSMDGWRRDDVTAIAADIDAGTDPAGVRRNWLMACKPRMAAARSDHDTRFRNGSVFRSSARRLASPSAPSTSSTQKPRGHAGRNRDVALGIGPVAADGCGVGGRG